MHFGATLLKSGLVESYLHHGPSLICFISVYSAQSDCLERKTWMLEWTEPELPRLRTLMLLIQTLNLFSNSNTEMEHCRHLNLISSPAIYSMTFFFVLIPTNQSNKSSVFPPPNRSALSCHYIPALLFGLWFPIHPSHGPSSSHFVSFVWIYSWVVNRRCHVHGGDKALSVANALIHLPNIQLSVERSHGLQQADIQEEQMEGEDGAEHICFSALCLPQHVVLKLVRSLPSAFFVFSKIRKQIVCFPNKQEMMSLF